METSFEADEKATATEKTPYFERPLGPAPLPVLAGVVALGIGLLYAAVNLSANDWVTVFAGTAVLVSCTCVLDYTGRREAARNPLPVYEAMHLPGHKSRFKVPLTIATLVVLLGWATLTADPGDTSYGSPMPYLMAAGFILFVMPQLLARIEMRRSSSPGTTA